MEWNQGLGFASAGQATSELVHGYTQSNAQKRMAEAEKLNFDFNRDVAKLQAKDAVSRGKRQAHLIRKMGRQMIGSQRVALAAQGVELDSGTALALQEQTNTMASIDAITIKANAYREAWGYKVQAMNYGNQGAQAIAAGNYRSFDTLMTGAFNAGNYGMKSMDYFSSGGGGGGVNKGSAWTPNYYPSNWGYNNK